MVDDKKEQSEIGGICPKCKIFVYMKTCPVCRDKVNLAKVGVIWERGTLIYGSDNGR